jgi:hypothetical protein
VGHASQGGPFSGELLVTAIIFPRQNGTAEDWSEAFNDFSEQDQREVTYD